MNIVQLSGMILGKPIMLLVRLLLWLSPSTVIAANINIVVTGWEDDKYVKMVGPTLLIGGDVSISGSALITGVTITGSSVDELFYDPILAARKKAGAIWIKEMLMRENPND